MDNIGTIFYEQPGLMSARLTNNDASPDLVDDKTQWKGRVHNQHIINNQFIVRRENCDIRRISSPRRPVRPTPPHHARYESPFSMAQAGMTMTQPYRKPGSQLHRNCHGPATLPALCRISLAVVSPTGWWRGQADSASSLPPSPPRPSRCRRIPRRPGDAA